MKNDIRAHIIYYVEPVGIYATKIIYLFSFSFFFFYYEA